MKRFGWIAIVAALAATAQAGAPPPPTFNVDCVVGWQGCYRAQDWTPVHFRIGSSSQEPVEYTLMVSGEQSERTLMTISHRFVLASGDTLPVPLVTQIGGGSYTCRAWLLDSAGRKVWEKEYSFYDMDKAKASLVPVNGGDVLIGVHRFNDSRDRSDFGLRELGKNVHSVPLDAAGNPVPAGGNNTIGGMVYVKERPQKEMPYDWTGYQSLDLLILYDPDWTALLPQQVEAIRQWVSGGGRLMMVLGANPLPANHPLAQMLPLTLGEAHQVSVPMAQKSDWGFEGDGPVTVTAWGLEENAGAWGWKVDDNGLWASGPVGFGRVGVLAFDPAAFAPHTVAFVRPGEKPDVEAAARASAKGAGFWVKRAKLLTSIRSLEVGVLPDSSDRYNTFASSSGSSVNAILAYLLDIREMRPINIIWIVLLLLGLAVVIGPVDYFVLKRRDRLPLTWMTFTIYIVVFSVVAYYGVKVLRSGPTQYRAVSVVDSVQGGPYAWGSCYSGIFANESADYALAGLSRGQWWSVLTPRWGNEMYDEPGPMRQASQRMACAQEDGANLPTYLPINVWSMQCLMTEGVTKEALLEATIDKSSEGLTAHITNLSDTPIKSGYIRLRDDRALQFGDIAARGTREVKGRPVTVPPWRIENENAYNNQWDEPVAADVPPTEAIYTAPGAIGRTRAILDCLKQGAAVVVVEYADAPCPYGLKDRSFTTVHTRCARLVVIPVERQTP